MAVHNYRIDGLYSRIADRFLLLRSYLLMLNRVIRIPHPGDNRQGSLTGEKGKIVGGSRFFAGKGAWIRRVEGLEGGDG